MLDEEGLDAEVQSRQQVTDPRQEQMSDPIEEEQNDEDVPDEFEVEVSDRFGVEGEGKVRLKTKASVSCRRVGERGAFDRPGCTSSEGDYCSSPSVKENEPM